jgi:predicted  nucleic acid-binding Zn-ribbon protein
MFVGLEESMARKNVSLKPISKEVKKAVKELKKIRSKASAEEKKILDLGITILNTANNLILLACRGGMNV